MDNIINCWYYSIISIITLIATWKVYKKAGKGGWESIVPFYTNWVLVEIAGLNWWWFLLILAPLVDSFIGLGGLGTLVMLFAMFNCYYNISKRFNKGVGFAICLTLFTPICLMILGFSKKNVYDGSIVVSSNGVFPGKNVSKTNGTTSYQNNAQLQQNYNQPMNNMQPTIQQQMNNVQQVQNSICSKCGSTVNPGDRFCMNCGNQL